MPRQQSSINSNNWRQPQGPLNSEINKVGQSLKSLAVTQPRRNRGNTFTSNMPTIDEDNSFSTVKPKKMREAPVELYGKAYAIQSSAAMYGADKTGASRAESRTFSKNTPTQGSLKQASLAQGINEDVMRTSKSQEGTRKTCSRWGLLYVARCTKIWEPRENRRLLPQVSLRHRVITEQSSRKCGS